MFPKSLSVAVCFGGAVLIAVRNMAVAKTKIPLQATDD